MEELSQSLIDIWLEDGQKISEHYNELILKEGILSAKSLNERAETRDFSVFANLLSDVVIEPNYSLLDIGCGKGELLDYLMLNLPYSHKLDYLGIDIVPAFISAAKEKYPRRKFQKYNFVQASFFPEKQFDIVIALGVLVTRVREYNLFFEYFVNKMVKCAKKPVVFNIISEIEAESLNYSNPKGVGHSTVLDIEVLHSVINSIDCADWRIKPFKIFPDATDMFVSIQL
ncbi:membrane-associated protein (plasmid) [Nostoc sp. HK-01]|nr:membrane-associated protein [Nostoc sp. HK-01]